MSEKVDFYGFSFHSRHAILIDNSLYCGVDTFGKLYSVGIIRVFCRFLFLNYGYLYFWRNYVVKINNYLIGHYIIRCCHSSDKRTNITRKHTADNRSPYPACNLAVGYYLAAYDFRKRGDFTQPMIGKDRYCPANLVNKETDIMSSINVDL